jgi:hypothetical protein
MLRFLLLAGLGVASTLFATIVLSFAFLAVALVGRNPTLTFPGWLPYIL